MIINSLKIKVMHVTKNQKRQRLENEKLILNLIMKHSIQSQMIKS